MESSNSSKLDLNLLRLYSGGMIPERTLDLFEAELLKTLESSQPKESHLLDHQSRLLARLRSIENKRGREHSSINAAQSGAIANTLQLSAEDFLILASSIRGSISEEDLSILLGVSRDHLQFRRQQILRMFTDSQKNEVQKWFLAGNTTNRSETNSQSGARKGGWTEKLRSLPTGFRFFAETGLVLGALVFLMWLIPEIRNRYEKSIQRRINDYLIESTISDAPAPEGTSKTPRIVQPIPEEAPLAAEAEPTPGKSESSTKRPLKVNAGETWRFSFTGSATQDILNGLSSVMKRMGKEEPKSVTVPGGIQFDFYLPAQDLSQLKLNLEEMTFQLQRRLSQGPDDSMSAINMSWYKKRGMTGRKIPNGQVEVVIWVSTL